MAQQPINVGQAPGDGTGDPLRNAGEKINANFTELYQTLDGKPNKPTTSTDKALARYSGTDGKQLLNSPVIVGDAGEISGYAGNINLQTGTSYTLLASDTGKIIELDNASPIALNLPNNLPVGWCASVAQAGNGKITVVPASGAAVTNVYGKTKTRGKGAVLLLYVFSNVGGMSAQYRMSGDVGTSFRGALSVAANTTNPPDNHIVNWLAPEYDTDEIWSSAQPTRMTVPPGVSKVEMRMWMVTANQSGSVLVRIRKNGAAMGPGGGNLYLSSGSGFGGFVSHNTFTAAIPVVPGDYFDVLYESTDNTTSFNGSETWFSMRIIE
jgi:hypothetical protein